MGGLDVEMPMVHPGGRQLEDDLTDPSDQKSWRIGCYLLKEDKKLLAVQFVLLNGDI